MRVTTAAEYTAKQHRRARKPKRPMSRNVLAATPSCKVSFGPTCVADREPKVRPMAPGVSVWAVLAAMAGRRQR